MGQFADKYGKDTQSKKSINTYDDLLIKLGEKQANEFLENVEDEIYTEKEIRDTYPDTKNKKEHKSDYEMADFSKGGELSDNDKLLIIQLSPSVFHAKEGH